jgi:hypothetical protein
MSGNFALLINAVSSQRIFVSFRVWLMFDIGRRERTQN